MFHSQYTILTSMTTRSYYNLQNQVNAGPANQPIVRPEDIVHPGSAPIVDSRGLPFALVNSPIPGPTVALYSDIVVSRPPSPREETEARLLAISPEDVQDEQVETGHLDDRSLAYITTDRIMKTLPRMREQVSLGTPKTISGLP